LASDFAALVAAPAPASGAAVEGAVNAIAPTKAAAATAIFIFMPISSI
jgi:hypothetical protein